MNSLFTNSEKKGTVLNFILLECIIFYQYSCPTCTFYGFIMFEFVRISKLLMFWASEKKKKKKAKRLAQVPVMQY